MRESLDGRETAGTESEADRVVTFQMLAEQHIHEAYKLANSVLASSRAAETATSSAWGSPMTTPTG